MEINELQALINELRSQGLSEEDVVAEVRRRIEAEVDDDDEVECGYDRPIAGVPLPPLDLMIDTCGR